MKTVLNQTPPVMEAWLVERRSHGQDTHDEVWDGVYHVAPAATPAHADLQAQVLRLLHEPAAAAGLRVVGEVNLGAKTNFRVPDGALLVGRPTATVIPSAVMVIEVVSPSDETWQKLEFYFAHDVAEMLVIDPVNRRVDWLTRGAATMVRAESSQVLGLSATQLHAMLDWPPTA